MGIRYTVFGKPALNVNGDVRYTTIDRHGNVWSFELPPIFNKETGKWDCAEPRLIDTELSTGDATWDGDIGELPSGIDAEKCIFAFAGDITEDNWQGRSLWFHPDIEIEKGWYFKQVLDLQQRGAILGHSSHLIGREEGFNSAAFLKATVEFNQVSDALKKAIAEFNNYLTNHYQPK